MHGFWFRSSLVKSDQRRRFSIRPSAEHVSACGRQNEAPRRTREKTSGTQGNPSTVFFQILKKTSERISMDTAGNRALKLVNKGAMTPQSREILQMLVW